MNTEQMREAFEALAQDNPMGKYSVARRGDGYNIWDAAIAKATHPKEQP